MNGLSTYNNLISASSQIFDILNDGINLAFSNLKDDITNYQSDAEQKVQHFMEIESRWEIEEQKSIYEIRRKQIKLLKELEKLKQREKQILTKINEKKKSLSKQKNSPQINTTLESVKKSKNPQIIRKNHKQAFITKVPDPVIPEMSRQQFQQKIKEMASNIRSKVKKINSFAQKQQIKHRSESKNKEIKYKYEVNLPEIDNKSYHNSKFTNLQVYQQMEENQQAAEGTITSQTLSKLSSKSINIPNRIVKSILNQIIKKTFQKIVYNEKYGIKLDPIHHKYPMTSFRRKIIQERHQKSKQRNINESMRHSKLEQRKEIFQKSRIK